MFECLEVKRLFHLVRIKMAGLCNVVVPVLQANNFKNWRFRIMTLLAKEQCDDIIEKEAPAASADAKVKEEFLKKDTKAKAVIVQGVSDKHIDIIKDCKTAKAQLEALKEIFVRTSSFTKLSLWRKLFNLKSSQNDKLEDHFMKFDSIIRDLDELGSKIAESDKVCHLLLSLPTKYDAVVTALETVSDVKMDFVRSRLLDEEIKQSSKQDVLEKDEVMFQASTKGCFICGDKYHFKADCPNRRNQKNQTNFRGSFRGGFKSRGNRGNYRGRGAQNQKTNEGKGQTNHQASIAEEPIMLYAANMCNELEDKREINFVLDSGASNHFVSENLEKYMYNIKDLSHQVSIHIANGQVLNSNKIGTLTAKCQGQTITIEALIVPNMKHNLLSASKITSKGVKLVVEHEQTTISGNKFNLICKNRQGLYILKVDPIINEECCAMIENDIWHKRLGHAGKTALNQLGLKAPDKICTTCVEGKATRPPFRTNEKRTTAIGEIVHSDICGPITPCTIDGGKYFQVILDDFSHFLVVKILKNKNEAEDNLKNYVEELKTQHNVPVKSFRLDNGDEFTSTAFKDYAKRKGIYLEYTMPYSPQMNGKSERMNRTLLNMIRTKIIESGIPKPLWGEALKCSAYELNRTPTTALDKGMTPSQIWHGRNDISKLRIFGCRAWYVNLPRGNKIDSKSTGSVMVGYCGGGYRLWHIRDEKIVKSRDVTFDESVMEYKEIERNLNQSLDLPEDERNGIEKVANEIVTKSTGEESDKIIINNNKNLDKDIEDEIGKSETVKTRSGRTVTQPKNLHDYEVYNAYCFLSSSNEESKTYQEAIESSKWQEAITKELDSHEKLHEG